MMNADYQRYISVGINTVGFHASLYMFILRELEQTQISTQLPSKESFQRQWLGAAFEKLISQGLGSLKLSKNDLIFNIPNPKC